MSQKAFIVGELDDRPVEYTEAEFDALPPQDRTRVVVTMADGTRVRPGRFGSTTGYLRPDGVFIVGD